MRMNKLTNNTDGDIPIERNYLVLQSAKYFPESDVISGTLPSVQVISAQGEIICGLARDICIGSMRESYETPNIASTSFLRAEQSLITTHADVAPYSDDPLAELLIKWNIFDDLYEFLKAKGINIESLKVMKERHLDEIFGGQNLNLKIIFEHKLEEWQNECGIYNLRPRLDAKAVKAVISSMYSLFNNTTAHTPSTSTTRTCSEELSVLEILEKDLEMKSLLRCYEERHKLTPKNRTTLVHKVIQYFIENEKKISVKLCKMLAKQIVTIFPTESMDTYFVPGHKKVPPKGKLWDRYQCRKRSLRKLSTEKMRNRKTGAGVGANLHEEGRIDFPDDSDGEFEKISSQLKLVGDWEHVVIKWKITLPYRRRQLQRTDLSLQEILKNWPLFKDSRAPELVDIDFNYSNPGKSFNFASWEKFCQVAEDIFSQRVKDAESRNFLNQMLEKRNDLNIDNRNICYMKLLHAILVPTPKVLKEYHLKFKIRDSQRAFTLSSLQVSDIDTIVSEKRAECIKAKTTLQPLIIAVGNEWEYNGFYVVLDDIKYAFESYLEAVQYCFKLIDVLNLKYPIRSFSVWVLIQKFLFDIESNAKYPVIDTFVKDIGVKID